MAKPADVDELRKVLEGLLRLHDWQGELYRQASQIVNLSPPPVANSARGTSSRSNDSRDKDKR